MATVASLSALASPLCCGVTSSSGTSHSQCTTNSNAWGCPRLRSSGVLGALSKPRARVVAASSDGNVTDIADTSSEDHGILPSGEWPENFSLLNYEDLSAHYHPVVFKDEAQPDKFLGEIMSTKVWYAAVGDTLDSVKHHFDSVTGLPVVDEQQKVVGVLSKKDCAKSKSGLQGRVAEVMTAPAVTLSADHTVQDAAVLMLKNKVHRIPVVNAESQLIGIVTRTDIFSALEEK